MSLYHIITGGHEFIGKWDKNMKNVILLRDAVKLQYIHNQQGTAVHMNNLKNDNNYNGKVIITDGPGVIKIQLQDMGELAKAYQKAFRDIQIINNSKIILPKSNLSKIH